MNEKGWSPEKMATVVEASRSTVYRWMDDSVEPRSGKLRELARRTEYSYRWLLTGEGDIYGDSDEEEANGGGGLVNDQSLFYRSESSVSVRHFGKTGAGDGRAVLEVVRHVELKPKEYQLLFGPRKPEDVGLFEVDGDSAAPEYFSGEDVPVEVRGSGSQEFNSDEKYVFRYDEDSQLKRLRRLDDGTIEAKSLNPAVAPRILKPMEHDFEILGKVIDTPKQQLYTALLGRHLLSD